MLVTISERRLNTKLCGTVLLLAGILLENWNRLSFFEHKCPVSSDTFTCVYVGKTVQAIFNQPFINFLVQKRKMRVFYVIFKKWIIKESVWPGGQEFRNIFFCFNLNFWYMFSYRIPFSPTNHESYKSLLMVEVHCLHLISVDFKLCSAFKSL